MKSVSKLTLLVALLAALPLLVARAQFVPPPHQPDVARGKSGMIVAAEPFAAEAGLEILRKGGNAVDAAVAVSFALAVTHPQAGNLGGGGFLLIRLADGRAVFLDYRETAPAAASAGMYLDAAGNPVPQASTVGWRASGVPGTVAGLELALRSYGTMSLAQVLEPAIRLAQRGFPVGERLAADLREPESETRLSSDRESRRIFLRNGKPYKAGEIFKQPELARTLKRIARNGAREFYEGSLAAELARAMKRHGGLLTRDDLRGYQPVARPPLGGRFREFGILTAPPPSSGGIALLEMLAMLDPLLEPGAEPLAPATLHVVAEAMRRAFAARARYLGDPDFACVSAAALVEARYAEALRASIDPQRATPSAELALPEAAGCPAAAAGRSESGETTHLSVIDRDGNAVSNTYTLNDYFGSGVTVPGLGFLLNNEMDDFTTQPGGTNSYNLRQSEANKIEPRKRPLSSMTPTLVTRDGKIFLVLGSPGGPRIINAVLLVLLNRLVFGRALAEAIALPRYHQQWLPDALFVEEGFLTEEQRRALEAMGHAVRPIGEVSSDHPRHVGQVNAIERDPETRAYLGVADGRRGNVARGY
jgi:gamma-glutamyltranspeptidase/glutathione hydrolase